MNIKNLNIEQKIFTISPYKPGESGKNLIKLSANENPEGCSKKIVKNKKLLQGFNIYPDGSSSLLKEEIAKLHKNIKAENIICGAGSDEVFNLLITAFTKPGDEIIYSQYGFLMYKIYAASHGVKAVAAKEKNLKTNITEIINSITKKTRIIFIANPNNPTGSYITASEIEKLCNKIDENILIVIDGAYAEYVKEDDYISGVELVKKYKNIIATRTFSKIYGLAALRIGYGIMQPELIDVIDRVRGPFNVSKIAQEAAIIAIKDQKFVNISREKNLQEQQYLETELTKLNIKFHKTFANFLLIDVSKKEIADKLFLHLKDSGIIVRKLDAYSLPNKIRITIGTRKQNKLLIKTLKKF
jgi:histidinol-phosphate aminotransferase